MNDNIYDLEYYSSILEGWNYISYEAIANEIKSDNRFTGENISVIDVGCGTCLYKGILLNNNNRYVGMDISYDAIKIARENEGVFQRPVNVLIGAAENIPILDNAFDYVFSTEVIEHVNSPAQMLSEIYRILKPGGCGLLTTTTYQFIIFHYLWVVPNIGFRLMEFIRYFAGYIRKNDRDNFVKLLYNYTGGHLWGFLKKDIVDLFNGSSLTIEDIYFLNIQPIIPFKLSGNKTKKFIKMVIDKINNILLFKSRAFYGPNIVVKFKRPFT